jgi:hypothetical protein
LRGFKEAAAVAVIVLDGREGSGFAVAIVPELRSADAQRDLARALRYAAEQIEKGTAEYQARVGRVAESIN